MHLLKNNFIKPLFAISREESSNTSPKHSKYMAETDGLVGVPVDRLHPTWSKVLIQQELAPNDLRRLNNQATEKWGQSVHEENGIPGNQLEALEQIVVQRSLSSHLAKGAWQNK